MGFDNECILNMQSLPGEYFCPVCRLLVYPNEALQTLCTHLYCKPCLSFVVGSTRSCPYDGYLVTEADAKPLIEANKPVADAIGLIQVHCLYHRSGCAWQGTLADCTAHCTGCAFGDSPVVCNRCGTQIVHRQVQEHALNCPGVQPQTQQQESTLAPSAEQTQAASQAMSTTAAVQGQNQGSANAAHLIVGPQVPQAIGQGSQSITQVSQAHSQAQAPTAEQWYQQQQQQQYQQYYQQYGYESYQQYYQQNDPYQQQQFQQQQQHIQPHPQHVVQTQAQAQAQPYMQPQPQSQTQPQASLQAQPQAHAQLQTHPQSQPQIHPHPQSQMVAQPQPQAPVNLQQQQQQQPQQQHLPAQPLLQMQPRAHPPPQSQLSTAHLQSQSQPQLQAQQLHSQPHIHPQSHPHAYPQPHPQARPSQMHQPQPHPRPSQPQSLAQPPQPQHMAQPAQPQHMAQPAQPQHMAQPAQPQHMAQPPQPQHLAQPSQPHPQPQHPPAHAVTGHQSYPQHQLQQQMSSGSHQLSMHTQHHSQQQGVLQHAPAQMPGQLPPHQPPHMRPLNPPPQSPMPVPIQQQPAPTVVPPQSQHPNVLPHPSQQLPHHPPQQSMHQVQPQFHQQLGAHGHFPGLPTSFLPQQSMQSQQSLRPQGMHHPHGHALQNIQGSQAYLPDQSMRPLTPNKGPQHHTFPLSTAGPTGHPQGPVKAADQPGISQRSMNQTYMPKTNSQQSGSIQQSPQLHSGSQTGLLHGSAPGLNAQIKQDEPLPEGTDQLPETEDKAVHQKAHIQAADSPDPKISGFQNDAQFGDNEGKRPNESEEKSIQPILPAGGTSASLSKHEIDSEMVALKKELQEPVKDAEDTVYGSGEDDSLPLKKCDDMSLHEIKEETDASGSLPPSLETDKGAQTQALGSVSERAGPSIPPQGHILGQPSNQSASTTNKSILGLPQFTGRGSAGPVLDEYQGLPPSSQVQTKSFLPPVPIPEKQSMPYGNPPLMHGSSQRLLAPNQLLQTHLPHPGPNQVQQQGQLVGHMRPQGPSQLPPAHDYFRPPLGKQSHALLHSEHPPGVLPSSGMPASLGRGPNVAPHQGLILPAHAAGAGMSQAESLPGPPIGGPFPGSFDLPGGMMVRGPPPHGPEGQVGRLGLPLPMESETFGHRRPGMFDGSQPVPHPSASGERGQLGQSSGAQSNMMKINGAPEKGFVGEMQESAFPYGLAEERFKHVPDERYRFIPGEGFRPPTEESFKPLSFDPTRRAIDRRELEEDLKHFPRPTHLDREGGPKYESYFSSMRPFDRGPHALDRAPHGFGHDAGSKFNSRPPPFFPSGGPHPPDSGERSRFHDDSIGKTDHPEFFRPVSEFGFNRMENSALRSPGREYPGIAPSRFGSSTGGIGLGGQSRLEELDVREPPSFGDRPKPFSMLSDSIDSPFHESRFRLPSHIRKGEFDGHRNFPINLRSGELAGPPSHSRFGEHLGHLRGGEPLGPRAFPSNFRIGEPLGPGLSRISEPTGFGGYSSRLPSHSRIGESIGVGNFPSRMQISEPGLGNFSKRNFANEGGFNSHRDMEPFDHARKRKPASVGWCRICKIDCETVEGLDLHSQTREHQKMAMDMVLSIKQSNAKKQKLSSEEHSQEDANKSQNTDSEIRGTTD